MTNGFLAMHVFCSMCADVGVCGSATNPFYLNQAQYILVFCGFEVRVLLYRPEGSI